MSNLYSINIPCELSQDVALFDSSSLKITNVVRVVPKKRLVCKARWKNQQVYAKLFVGSEAEKYAQRDKSGVELLLKAKIATPKILYFGQLTNVALYGFSGPVFVMLLEAISSELTATDNVETLWQLLPLASNERLMLAKHLVTTVAKHHDAGLQQTDLYLKNFILCNEIIYTLDGDGIKSLPSKFNHGQVVLKNLTALLSKFDVLELERWLPQLLKIYADARGWKSMPRIEMLQHLIILHRNKTSNSYANKKVFRTCTDVEFSEQINKKNSDLAFECKKLNGFACLSKKLNGFLQTHFTVQTWLVRAYVQYAQLSKVEVLDASLIAPAFKNGNTCTVGLVTVYLKQADAKESALNTNDAQKIVVKRYNIKSVWHAFARSVRKTRAAVSWSNAHRLLLLGLPTSAPVALIETHYFFGLLKSKSYFLSAYIDAPDIAEFFANERDKIKRAKAVKQMVELLYRLFLLKISHGDLKASNIKMLNHQPILIDLDSMQQHTFGLIAVHSHARDLTRFMRNWQHDDALLSAFKKSFKVIYTHHQPLKMADID